MKKNKLILLQLIIAVTFICTTVYATVNTTISLSVASTTVKQGEEITIKLSLENVEASKKVYSVEGYINYNKDILEPITVDSIEKNDNNTVKIGDEELSIQDVTNSSENIPDYGVTFNGAPSTGNDAKILIDFRNGISSNTDLLNIKFKVKADAKLGTVSNAISYQTFQITAGTETSPDIDKNVNLTIVSNAADQKPEEPENKPVEEKPENKPENKPTENKPENKPSDTNKNTNKDNNKNTNTNTNKNKNTNTNTNTNKNLTANKNNTNTDGTVAGTNLPATGSKVIIIPAIVLIVLAYVSYNKYMKYKDI